MTQISQSDVRWLAQLSSLELSEAEMAELQADLSHILEYIDQLGELDTSGVEPTYQVNDQENIWRDDEVVASRVTREQLLALAPEQKNNQLAVPKVL